MTPLVRIGLAAAVFAITTLLAFLGLDGIFEAAEDGDVVLLAVAIGAAFLGITILHAP